MSVDITIRPETNSHVLTDWNPEDPAYWESKGRKTAFRNLFISMPALLLAFAVWMVWSVVVVNLPNIGFKFDTDQLFWLAALPGLSGATLRIFYSFMVPIFGGRLWTALSTASLLLPAIGAGIAVQNPSTPYAAFLILALLCGFGGGNFASSMANISFFFPKAKKGMALGMNAGIGNLGVSVVQFVVPLVIASVVFGTLGGEAQTWVKGDASKQMWLQNAGFIWVPFIIVCSLAAWFGMNDISTAKASFSDQAVIFKRKHNWIMCWLYIGTFGSFIGYSAGFPLLIKTQFSDVNPLTYAFLGPLVGSVARVIGGFLSDKLGGGRVTFWTFLLMIVAVFGVLHFLEAKNFEGFLAMFLLLFAGTGVGNASTFQMIPIIFLNEQKRLANGTQSETETQKLAGKEAAAVLGFSSALAAYGAFFIPKSYGTSISMTGGPEAALYGFIIFYVTCVMATWWWYARKNAEIKC
ncbi:MAG: NarK family nitrate/nitrite MFS transporter [Rhodospirillales bacterium]|jgi:NNP family nitrate/nitrite transporter-like MFS transporter|nr:NarK family nitrate/nitrite MFS transporter [Rhodospirillales bacterium]